jgi:ARG/rhodanese/phosphatase superfamily protein
VLAPITHGNLTIFPVVAATTHDTHEFLTLDEGLRSGEVIVTEAGRVQPLMRRRGGTRPYPGGGGAQVNSLVLVNNSKRPLLLLAGEIVTGGKQDRVIGKDRIVPAESDPIDLGVFCVEPGRWVASSDKFGGLGAQMAQPSVRKEAMAAKDQQRVWAEVGKSRQAMIAAVPAASAEAVEVSGGSSYAKTADTKAVREQVDSVAKPIEQSYSTVIRQLKDQHAVGVVVAINGEIEWADIFASTELLQKYWPKLVRSYAAETIGVRGTGNQVGLKSAQAFLDDWSGKRQTVETEPGLFRHVEVAGRGFRAFQLTSLLPQTGFDLHLSKMAEESMIGE